MRRIKLIIMFKRLSTVILKDNERFRYSYTHSESVHWTEMCGDLDAPVALSPVPADRQLREP